MIQDYPGSRIVYHDNWSAYHLRNIENKFCSPQPHTDYLKRSFVQWSSVVDQVTYGTNIW